MNLRRQVLRGGAYLAVRQGLGMAVNLGGVVLLTRLIGPTAFGLYTAAFGIVTFLNFVGRCGLDVYLIRREDVPDRAVLHQAFTLLALGGLGLAGVASAGVALGGDWFGDARFLPPLQAMLPALFLSLLPIPAVAQLERALDFRAVAVLELAGQVAFYAVALPLALAGAGVWAPVAGYWGWQAVLVVGSYARTGYRPRLAWSPPLARELLRYGVAYSASSSVWQARGLVNPLVVGRFLGPEAVAYVGLAVRLVDALAFVKRVTWRLAIASLAKVQGERDRLRRALEEAMGLQVMALGPLLAGFALVAPVLVPAVFGGRFDAVLEVYPFVALGCLANAVFNMHSSVLYVLGQNRRVAAGNAAHVVLLAVAALVAVPRVGLWGYGAAEVVALGSYAVVHAQTVRLVPVSYARVLPWLLGLSPALFAPLVPLPWRVPLALPILALALWPGPRRQVAGYVRAVRPGAA